MRAHCLLVIAYLLASMAAGYVVLDGNRAALRVPAQQIGRDYQNVTFPSRSGGVRLSGWLFHSRHPTGRSIILVHGWRGDREDVDFVAIARRFLSEGYDVLMFDLRASGSSGGVTQTLATLEPGDLLGAYDFMRGRGYQPRTMVILGNSMGAATVIEAAPDLSRVGALICDSAFTSATAAVEGAVTNITHLPGVLGLPMLAFAQWWGVNPAVAPVDVVASLPHRAFLFIQSRGDSLIPQDSAALLYAASRDPQSRLLLINSHHHLATYNADPAGFMGAVNAFIATQIQPLAVTTGSR